MPVRANLHFLHSLISPAAAVEARMILLIPSNRLISDRIVCGASFFETIVAPLHHKVRIAL